MEVKPSEKPDGECVDRNDACELWVKSGYCESRPDIMRVECRKSCRICSKLSVSNCQMIYKCKSKREGRGGRGEWANDKNERHVMD